MAVTRAISDAVAPSAVSLEPVLGRPDPVEEGCVEFEDVGLEANSRPGPPPSLQRPVLFVHGYNSGTWVFNAMSTWMAGADGTTNPRGGEVSADTPASGLPAEGRLFTMHFSKPWQCAEDNADELAAAIEAVCRATGSPTVDLVTHSMGALDARVYLDRGGSRIGKMAMVAPPNHGSLEADLALWLRDNLNLPLYPSSSDPDVREALLDLRADASPKPTLGDGNPFLVDLNRRWQEQKSRLMDVAVMVGGGVPTVEPDGTFSVLGDGFVPWSSSTLPGLPMRSYCNSLKDTHGRLLRDSRVAVDVARFLVNQGLDRCDTGGDAVVLPYAGSQGPDCPRPSVAQALDASVSGPDSMVTDGSGPDPVEVSR